MDNTTRLQLERNIFHAAHQACEPWDQFPWHTGQNRKIDTHVEHASQALAIDVFGTIKMSSIRDVILDALAQSVGLPTGGPWTVTLEWNTPKALLGEPRPTQVDVYVESPQAVLVCECKFTETNGGACSQTNKKNGGAQCNGHYELQINPKNGVTNRCALSGKQIRYWEVIPQVFRLDAKRDYRPCPFAGPTYQWMRNLLVGYEQARSLHKQAAVIIVYADAPHLSMAKKVRSSEWTQFVQTVKQEGVTLQVRSYQEILLLAQEVARGNETNEQVWTALAEWVDRKIAVTNIGTPGRPMPAEIA
jgi:hypothetical protein